MSSGTFDIARAQVGDRVQHEFLVVEREEKRQASGDPFVLLTLGNASGRIATAPIWSNQMDWALGAEKGKVVQVIGEVAAFHGKRQVRLTAPLRVLPDAAVRAELFLPRIGVATEPLWDWIDRARSEMKSHSLRRAVDLFFGDDSFREEFERAPASVSGHHAALGGLLLHVTEVATIARNAARVMKANADLVVVGALLHDIGKVRAYGITPTGFTHTPAGSLVGHVVLGALMLQERLVAVPLAELSPSQRLELVHLILSHHGALEFGSPVQPMTVEAELLHWADESSAKANDMTESLAEDEHFGDGEVSERRPWRVGRKVWRRPHTWE
ncbi:MAG: 3'-5' exoribonuclease YhaM family protein [Gemmatimonadota bacterium]